MNWRLKLILITFVGWATLTRAEVQTTLSISAPTLSPGGSGSFTASQVTGPAASTTSSLFYPYAGIWRYVLSAGSGRFASLSGTRYGLFFDTFQFFQAFLNNNLFSMVSAGTSCPSSQSYNWLLTRMRTPDAPRFPMDASNTSTRIGGVLSYSSSATPAFTSTSSFNLAGPTTSSTSYVLNNSGLGLCSNGLISVANNSGVALDPYGQVYFGSTFGMYTGTGGNPMNAILMPVQTLTAGIMTQLGKQVLTGLFTEFNNKTTQNQQNVYVVPNAAGTTFTLNTVNNFNDPTNFTNLATITCTTLNSPYNGFCKGTMTQVGLTGSSNVVCLLGSTSTQDVLACSFAVPNALSQGGSLVATRSSQGLMSASTPTTATSAAPGSSSTVAATLQNLTGTQITGLSNPASGQLTAPFSDPSAYTGSGGTCGATLSGFASCTLNISFSPTVVGTTQEVFRSQYNNQAGNVNATANVVGTSGLTSLAISPNSSAFAVGSVQQFTATATYSDGSTQDVSNSVIWTGSNNTVATLTSTGQATFNSSGTVTFTAALAAVSTSITPTVYVAPPQPSGLTATPASYTQINLSWTSGGGTTTAFQIAYQTGATAPADCNSGTVITSGVVGNVTSYAVTGLLPATTYAFRVCAANSAASLSAGITASATTFVPHYAFSTAGTFSGSIGGLYFADFICQTEATNASLGGIWKAAMSDASNSAVGRIALSQSIYNLRPSASGNVQLVSTKANFWNTGSVNYLAAINYTASGGSPGSGNTWTGSLSTGAINSTRQCSSWSTGASAVQGETGNDAAVNATSWANANTNCNTLSSLYCINLQSSSAAPPNPTGLTLSIQSSTYVQYSWSSGGGTTAAYKFAYQTGATAPVDCSTGTIIPAATIGYNPTSYAITGLSSNTQYSFRLCAVNSDQSQASSGVTNTVTTTSSGTITNLGTRQVMFSTAATRNASFGGIYFADYVCQTEANNAGLVGGVWKSVLSDEATSAISRITISPPIYNNRPVGSGGYQQIAADSASFWGSSVSTVSNYNAGGTAPGSANSWTGTQANGSLFAGRTCTSWTTASSGSSAELGQSNTTGNIFATGTNTCNTNLSLFCMNQQTSSAAPPDPTGFFAPTTTSTTVQFSWASGGGTTAAYQLSYVTGAAVPANCNTGTVISPATLGVNPTSYTVTGLTNSTQYSFRLCAVNSDASQMSAGVTNTLTTPASGTVTNLGTQQILFATAGTYSGSFGGIYFGDYVCQQEAVNNGLTGQIWKAVMSDDSTSAIGRIAIPGNVYNNRPSGSGGYQVIAANSASFWSSAFPFTAYYSASGGTPGTNILWTGTTGAGANISGSTCASWTTASSGNSGEYGNANTTGNIIGVATTTCNTSRSLLCTNQQVAGATPPDPTGFYNPVTSSTSLQFAWTSGGGSTAAYQMSYQAGATAPSDCNSGTVISATTLGLNPTSYTVTGLTASTQYSFRLCAENSDLSSASAGATITITTTATGSITNLGTRQVVFSTNTRYAPTFGGLYFADYICQTEANNAAISGTWKSILSDDTTSALSRIAIPGSVYNNRPSGSGGYQLEAANASSFWSSAFPATMYFNASGNTPGSNVNWTGTTGAGANIVGSTCASWTTASSGNTGQWGNSNTTGQLINSGNVACNNTYSLYCTNQQTSSAAPPDVTGFLNSTTSSTAIQFSWASSGGTTAAYQMSYQTGATPPVDCDTGTVIPPSTLGINPTGYTVSGLTASTQYSFRICAENSDQTAESAGVTLTVTTTASGTLINLGTRQIVFATDAIYLGYFGGIYYGDWACQMEANTYGLTGIWKAILSDDSTSALSRIAIPGNVYNNRPAASGGYQQVAANASSFWSNAFSFSMNYDTAGSTPGSTVSWTGSTTAGAINVGNTCTSWTTASPSVRGEYGVNTSTGNEMANGNNPCNNQYTLYCTNQQTAAAAPPDPATFASYSVGPTSVGLNWTPGGGTTAAFQMSYQTGATAPVDCNTGTVILPGTLGVNPSTYTISSLSASTQYSFRLCALNSDLSLSSTGRTVTITTGAAATNPTVNYGTTQVVFQTNNIYNANFGGLYFGDYICQKEAQNGGLTGTWKAILSDETTNASSRITVAGNIYNNRPLSSGGIQRLATNSATFFNFIFPYPLRYSAAGATPTNIYTWTGSLTTGALNAGLTCSSWTTNVNTSNAAYGVTSNTFSASVFDNANTACNNNVLGLYCTNQQTSSAAPPDASAFTSPSVSTSTVVLNWTSGGGTTAAFQLAYQTGATAPANCSTGNVVSYTTLGINPSAYTVTGLSSGTQYSFRLCALNSDFTQTSSGLTLSATTTATVTPANQTMFGTTSIYFPTFGGLYFGDFICQTEATNGGLNGVWKAILSDGTTTALSRITRNATIFNNRPTASGGPQQITTTAAFWSGAGWTASPNYSASGGAPGTNITWTGSTAAGAIAAGQHCSNWTTDLNTATGEYGNGNGTTSAATFATGTTNCNTARSLYCISNQTAAAMPSDPTGFTAYELAANSIGFNWASGGGTTAAYILTYTTGMIAPLSCTTGTIISATTLGVNPSTYTIQGLNPSTTYSFRLCATNSDQSTNSLGVTLTATTTASGTTFSPGSTQFIFATTGLYRGNMGGIYFADYVCQNEAANAGISGIWKSVLSDGTTSALSRIALAGNVFNLRGPSSGGAQRVTDNINFWNNLMYNPVNYTATGTTPSTTISWSGSTSAGASAASTCSNWTTVATTVNGQYGTNSSTNSAFSTGTSSCNNAWTLYCINQQTAAAAPSNPATFVNYSLGSSSIGLAWTSGGGTTAAYQLAYQTGATPPASCTAGTVIAPSTLGYNPTTYTLTGLSSSTQYSFRLCAMNSDLSLASSGVTQTLTTLGAAATTTVTPGNLQFVYSTATTYFGNFGGIYFGDFACQLEANNASMPGVWKSVTGDESIAGSSHISLSSAIYNLRPNSSGGIQQISNGTGFFSGPLLQNLNYSVNGGAPGSVRNWTGVSGTGAINTGLTCSSWSTQINTSNAEAGYSTTPTNGMINTTNACNTLNSLYCINQQTAASAPPDVASFTNYYTGPTSIGFAWTSGGGTTAAYQLAYQTGATAPANCNAGTVISAATLGVNPSSYTLSGLSNSTQYSFRLCALNSDLSTQSSGATLTLTTLSTGAPLAYTNNVQEIFATTSAYYGNFGGIYYADYACQQEAITAGYTGTWKALIADDTVTASGRISLATSIYNARPPASGGIQQISNGTGFWAGPWNYPTNYTASGGTPTTVRNWTGITNTGGNNTGNTCSSWNTQAAANNGEVGYSNTPNNALFLGTNTCNNADGFLCINQQTPSATPPNPATFYAYSVSGGEVGLAWTSGGGTTGAFQIAYQTGATAPANCTSGTLVTAGQLGMNPSTWAIPGLSATTQYSFRLCAANSDASAFSSGLTVTTTTLGSGAADVYALGPLQIIFSTLNLYQGNFGGIYFGDFACQIEAINAGMNGTWRSITGDETVAASTHISLSSAIYNNRPQPSNGIQKINNGTGFWPGVWSYNVNYNANGTAPGAVRLWGGNTNTGAINAGNTCTSWTAAVSTINGLAANSTNPAAGMFAGYNNCTTFNSLYCINQQSAAATPPNPASFSAYATGNTSVGLIWSSGGGTTAGYQLAYQTGATAPATCNTGTIISATTLGVNPSTYTVTGLASSTQYSFRLCAENSDLSAASSGLTVTTTTSASGTTFNLGTNQFIFASQNNYLGNFGGIYFSDYICQSEASTAGIPGIWKAILSDASNAASTHASMSGNLYNFRPAAAGGSQRVTNAASFYNAGTLYNTFAYTASGTTPGNIQDWTGTTTAGVSSGTHCNGWTTSANTISGTEGRNNVTTTYIANATATCNATRGIICVNQQTSSAAPPNPTSVQVYAVGSTYVGFNWLSGGGTTGTYQIAYTTGGTAPSNCNLGTVVTGVSMGVNPTAFAVNSLNPSTQYSFRLCAANSDSTTLSSGVTNTVTTLASGQTFSPGTTQFAFSTAAAYSPNFGGLYFGDYICQAEANSASLGGVWKAMLGDDTTAVTSHISVSGNIYNMNPGTSNGSQFATNSVYFYTGVLTNLIKYTASGGTPAKVNQWTGATTAGALNAGRTCNNWTNNTATYTAGYGVNTSSTNYIYNGTIACNNTEPLFCLNQQTASATPPNPATFTLGTKTTSSIQLNFTGGGGTTGAYQLAYQIGASAPANCTSGTVVTAATLGINPVTYTQTGLTSATQYSFRLCAENSSLTAASAGLTLTATTN